MSSPHPDPLADMLTKPHELDGKFESQAKTVTTCISDAAVTSIAVSLKRIADALDVGDASQGGGTGMQLQFSCSFEKNTRKASIKSMSYRRDFPGFRVS